MEFEVYGYRFNQLILFCFIACGIRCMSTSASFGVGSRNVSCSALFRVGSR